jgi:hypothetical protein
MEENPRSLGGPMIDSKRLLSDLERLLASLEKDLRERSITQESIDEHLREEFRRAKAASRTGESFETWRDELLTQVGVAWILGTVFVRFLEDNELVEIPRLSGTGERRKLALDQQTLYFQKHPTETDREYLLDVFRSVMKLPAAADLFDEQHNPLWIVGLSGDGATELLRFWQRVNPDTGTTDHDFTDPSWNTRFLGDLYQDLSEAARKKYALLQTPEFVEEFILDRTLTPAIETFGYKEVKLIDPACGSGHFLLGAFRRLLELRLKNEPGVNPRELVQRTLDQVYGVDVNPFAVAIARFRLLLAALEAAGEKRLGKAPGFRIHLAAGDSLLHGPRPGDEGARQRYLFEDPLQHVYEVEDAEELKRILGERYHVVVGNPPYITVKDKALNQAYRERFGSCHRQYSLLAPFLERSFDLARSPHGDDGERAGFVGVIAGNAFMKREFGKKLIEEYTPRWDLTHIIDTEGVPVPEHGTATVILLGRNRAPTSPTIRVVSCLRSDPPSIDNPAEGNVWPAITAQVDRPGSRTEYVTVTDARREIFHKHPWSLGGGGAAELKSILDDASESRLVDIIEAIGRTTVVGEDDVWTLDSSSAKRLKVEDLSRPFVVGTAVRDWGIDGAPFALYPYQSLGGKPVDEKHYAVANYLWPYRTVLVNRSVFGKTLRDMQRPWYEHLEHYTEKLRTPLSIAFAEVATHNHFVLDRGGKLFKQTAPVIKLPPNESENRYLDVLGLLNSSVACFWMKQVSYCKGVGGINEGTKQEKWERFYAFDGTKLRQFPLVGNAPFALTKRLDALAGTLLANSPAAVAARDVPSARLLEEARAKHEATLREMISMQEELDWHSYYAFGIARAPLTFLGTPPSLNLGERAFEIVMARAVQQGTFTTSWFSRHRSSPISELPGSWDRSYRTLVEERIRETASNPNLALIEAPEYKRRWNTQPWDEQLQVALSAWLLDRLEGRRYWQGATALSSCARVADRLRTDFDFLQVAELYRGRSDFDVVELVAELVLSESVPFLPVLRYKPSGLAKRAQWETTWKLQRIEDEGKHKDPIPVPPKYAPADFLSAIYWRLRGKLDVPKERFILFPHCERAADPSPLVLWAGFNHLQQAQAIAAYYLDMKDREGWTAERLTPLLAGIAELVPWVKQWHNDPDPKHGERMGDYFAQFLADEAAALGLTVEAIRAWKPPSKKAGKAKHKVKTA